MPIPTALDGRPLGSGAVGSTEAAVGGGDHVSVSHGGGVHAWTGGTEAPVLIRQ
ncbi:MAG: hypothetical protein ACRDTP_03125 [Mycobacteriales bacterium]